MDALFELGMFLSRFEVVVDVMCGWWVGLSLKLKLVCSHVKNRISLVIFVQSAGGGHKNENTWQCRHGIGTNVRTSTCTDRKLAEKSEVLFSWDGAFSCYILHVSRKQKLSSKNPTFLILRISRT